LQRVVGGAAVAQRDVEEAVGAEQDAAAVVVLERVVGRDPDPLLARGSARRGSSRATRNRETTDRRRWSASRAE
jgi:hypothetical protein